MRDLIDFGIFTFVVIAVCLLLIDNCKAEPFQFFTLQDVSMEARFFMGDVKHENTINPPTNEVNFNVNTDILRYGYFNNTIHSLADGKQFQLVGWRYQVGAYITPWMNVEYKHFSKHALDSQGPWQHFPVEDNIGVVIHFWQANKPKYTIFNEYFKPTWIGSK